MTPEELLRLTVKDLRALAERRGVTGAGRMRKDELLGLLTPLIATSQPSPTKTAPIQAAPAVSSAIHAPAAPAVTHGPNPGLPIPEAYGVDRLVLLVQDPHHIFAYWEITGTTYARVAAAAGLGASSVLVLHTPSGTEQREIDLRGGNYYLNVAPGSSFRAEVALRGRDGRLYLLATSNVVNTPAAGPSTRTDATWMEVDETFHELLSLAGLPGPVADASSLARLKARTIEGRTLRADELASKGLSSADLTRRSQAHLADALTRASLSSTALGKR